MKNRMIALFLALVMTLSMLPTAAHAADSDFVIKNGVLTKYTGSGGDVVIPDGATSIGAWAFENCHSLTSVTIGNSVSSIGNGAFEGCTSLTSVTIPDSVSSIGVRAFDYCESLTSIIVTANNPSYASRDGVLFSKDITTLIQYPGGKTAGIYAIPDSVTSIGEYAFSYCISLSSVTIPNSVTSIGASAFEWCNSLTSVTIPNSVTSIGASAFDQCTSLTSMTIPNSVTSIGACAFGSCTSLTSVTIPNSVTSIGTGAFSFCTSLTSMTIPSSVTSIAVEAFSHCTGLTSITIPDSVTSIGSFAFSNCTGLTNVTIPNSVTSIGTWAFQACTGLTGVTIPDSVTSIGQSMFNGCTSLTSVTIPNSVTSIGNYAFYQCTGLIGITIPNSVTDIGYSAFQGCTSLTSVTIPGSVTSIGDYAFWECNNLTNVTIGAGVTSIGENAFYDCSSLTDVYYNGSWTQWGEIYIGPGNDSLKTATIHYNSDINGCDASVNKCYIVTTSNWDILMDGEHSTVRAVFNKDIGKGSGRVVAHDVQTGGFISYPIEDSSITISNNTLSINLEEWGLYTGRSYYITIDSGAIKGTDGTIFYGLNDKDAWILNLPRKLEVKNITLEYAKKGWLIKRNDYSKPAIPAGTDEEYAELLAEWSWSSGYPLSNIKAKELLDTPVYLPVSDTNGSTFLLDDDSTTVRQVIEDIVFIENLKPFIEDLDKELAAVERYSTGSSYQITTSPLFQEAEIYNEMISWYGQIDEYMTGRKSGSNFVYSVAAPASHIALTKLIKTASGDSYQFIKPFLTAKLESLGNEAALRSLEAADDFNSFKNGVSDLQNALDTGKTVYTAITADGIGRIKLGTELLTKYFVEHSDNELVKEISSAYGQVKTMQSAVQLSMTVGCSLGAFPLVADLQQKLTRQLNDNVKAFYLIGDYYIADRYPNYYNAIYKTETYFPTYDLWNLIGSAATDLENRNSDPLLYNWDHFAQTEVESVESYRASVQLRQQLANYALLLRYVKSVNTESAIQGLIQYVSAISTETPTSTLYAKCPIRVNIYDNNSEELVASLSSEDGSIQDFEYGTLYLMGEDNDAKCFVLNSAEYRAEIVPYDAGTMDVLVVNDNGSGDVATTYFENVELNTNTVYELSSLLDDSLKRSEDQPVSATEAIPATGITLNGADELPIGASITYEAQVIPLVATDTTVIWNSSDERILTVDESGTANALATGEITLTATLENGIEVSKQVLIYTPATSCNIEETSVNMMVGEVFSPSIAISGSSPHKVSWISSDPAVASVDEDGQIHALSAGNTTLKAEIDGLSAEISVSVHADQLVVSLYQSDTQGQRLKVDLVNTSCASDFEGLVYVSIYKNGQMVFLQNLPANIPAGDTTTLFIPLDGYSTQDEYTAITLIMDADYVPHQEKVQMKILN